MNTNCNIYGAHANELAAVCAGGTWSLFACTDLRFSDTNKEWIEETVKDEKLRTGPLNDFQDVLFDNEMNALVNEAKKHYEETSYKLALKAGHYDFLNARDSYRSVLPRVLRGTVLTPEQRGL